MECADWHIPSFLLYRNTLDFWGGKFVQNVILYLFESRDKLNTLTEVLSVETANRRERHPGDSPQVTDFENKKVYKRIVWILLGRT